MCVQTLPVCSHPLKEVIVVSSCHLSGLGTSVLNILSQTACKQMAVTEDSLM